MKRFVLLVLILITGLTVFSQGIEFQKERYAEVLEMAKKQNKLVFIDIYTSWCGPCSAELINVRKAYDLLKDKGLKVVAISTDEKEKDWLKAVNAKKMNDFVNLRDSKRVLWNLFNRNSIPFILLIDPEG